MTANGWIQIAIYCALVTICVKPLGAFMAKVFSGERTFPLARCRAAGARHVPSLRH